MNIQVKQQGNTVLIKNLSTQEIIKPIGIQFFSYEFNQDTVQLVDSSKLREIFTVNLSQLYDDLSNPLNTEALVIAYLSTFTPIAPPGGGVSSVTGPAVDNTDPANPVVNSNFGLYSQTVPSALINTVGEQSIIGTGVGSLSIPANGFIVGDSFHGKIGGLLNATGGGGRSEIIINIKAGSIVLATTGVFDLDTATAQGWELELDFTLASIGVTGQICTNGNFAYTKDNNRAVYGYIFQDVKPIDTTINNTLDITVEWNVLNNNDDIYSANFVLFKTF